MKFIRLEAYRFYLKMIKRSNQITGLLITDFEAPPFVKLALLTLDNPYVSTVLSYTCFFLSQIHLFCVLLSTSLLELRNDSESIESVLRKIRDIFSVGDLLNLESPSLWAEIAIITALIYFAVSSFCFAYLMLVISKKIIPVKAVQAIWSVFTVMHSLVFFYPIHYTCVQTLSYLHNDKNYPYSENMSGFALLALVLVILILNLAFAFGIIFFLRANVKTKALLSSNTKYQDFIDLLFKSISPVLWFFDSSSITIQVLVYVDIICWALIKDLVFFYFLPYYNLNISKINSIFNAATTLFAVVSTITKFKTYTRFDLDLAFLVFFWAISLPFVARLYLKIFQTLSMKSLLSPHLSINPYYVLNNWTLYKNLSKKFVKPRLRVKAYREHQIYYNVILKHSNIPAEKKDLINADLETETTIDKHFFDAYKDTLKALVTRHPDSWILKAALALCYSKYKGLYVLADRLITEGLECTSLAYKKPSLYYVKFKLLKRMRGIDIQNSNDEGQTTESEAILDVQNFIRLQEIFSKLKVEMLKQLGPQIKFWKDFQNSEPDLQSLMNLALQVRKQAHLMKKIWQHSHLFIEAGFIKPLVIYGYYLSLIENDLSNGLKCLQEYNKIEIRMKHNKQDNSPMFERETFINESLYFTVSGDQQKLGKVLDCSGHLEKALGLPKKMLVNKNISIIMPPFYAEKHDNLLKASYNKSNFKVLDKMRELQVKNQNGFLLPCLLHVSLNFLPGLGLCYYGLMKILKNDNRIILIDEGGIITDFTENFAIDMRIKPGNAEQLDITHICPDLEEVLKTLIPLTRTKSKNLSVMQTKFNIKSTKSRITHLYSAMSSFHKKRTQRLSDKTLEPSGKFQKLADGSIVGNSLPFYPISVTKSMESINSTVKDQGIFVYNVTIQQIMHEGETMLECKLEKVGNLNNVAISSVVHGLAALRNLKFFRSRKSKMVDKSFGTISSDLMSMNSFELVRTRTSDIQAPAIPTVTADRPQRAPRKSIFHRRPIEAVSPNENQDKENFSVVPILPLDSKEGSPIRDKSFDKKASDSVKNAEDDQEGQKVFTTLIEDTTLLSPVRRNRRESVISPGSMVDSVNDKSRDDSTVLQEGELAKSPVYLAANLGAHQGDMDYISLEPSARPSMKIDSALNSHAGAKSSTLARASKFLEIEIQLAQEILGEDIGEGPKKAALGKAKAVSTQKIIQKVLKSTHHQSSMVYYYISTMLSIIIQLAFMLWLYFYANSVFQNVADIYQVLEDTYFRNYWLKLANQETRTWIIKEVDINANADTQKLLDFAESINLTYTRINEYNQDLRLHLSHVDLDIQNLFYSKKIKVFERNSQNTLKLISIDDSFQTMEKIISLGLDNVGNIADNTSIDYVIDYGSRFLFDNSFNDLLVVSEDIITSVENTLFSNLSDSKNLSTFVLSGTIVLIILFILVSIRSMYQINKDYLKFMKVFFTIPKNEAVRTAFLLTTFQTLITNDYDDSDFIEGLNRLDLIDVRLRKSQSTGLLFSEKEKKGNKRVVHKASMNKVYVKNQLTFASLFFTLTILIAYMVVYYYQAQDKFQTIESQNTSITSLLKKINLQVFVNVETQILIMDNAETMIRNAPALDSLNNDITTMKNVNSYQENLLNDKGVLSEQQNEILYNITCNYVYSSLYLLSVAEAQEECQSVSKGFGRLGLVNLLPDVVNDLVSLIAEFEGSTREESQLKILSQDANDLLDDLTDISTTLLLLLFSATKTEALDNTQTLDQRSLILVWVAVILSAIFGTLIWLFVVKRISSKEFERKKVLQIVPNRLIMSNIYLRRYIYEISKGRFDELRHFLE